MLFVLAIYFLSVVLTTIASGAPIVKLGIDVLGAQHPDLVRGKRIMLLVSSTARDASLTHTIDRLALAAKIQVIYTGDPYFRETIPGASSTIRLDALTNAEVREIQDPLACPTPDDFADTDLIVVDGGKPQVRVVQKILSDFNESIPLIGIAKRPDRLIIGDETLLTVKPPRHHPGFRLVQSLRDESHRFAKKYHLFLRGKTDGIMKG